MHLDEGAWVAIGFVIFVVLAWKQASAALGSMLDSRSDKIRAELDEARKLHDDAKAELENFRKLKAEAEQEAQTILANAKVAAERIRENAATRAEETIVRREAQAKAKITAAENALISELRQKASELAVIAARQVITDKLDSKASLALVEDSAKQIAASK